MSRSDSIESIDKNFFQRFANPNAVDFNNPHSASMTATSYAGSCLASDDTKNGNGSGGGNDARHRSVSPTHSDNHRSSHHDRRSSDRHSSRRDRDNHRSSHHDSDSDNDRDRPNRHNARALHKTPAVSKSTSASSASFAMPVGAVSKAANASVFGAAMNAVRRSESIESDNRGGGGDHRSSRRSHRRSSRRSHRRSSRRSTTDNLGDFDIGAADFGGSGGGGDDDDDLKVRDSGDERRQKQSYFIELQQLHKGGIQLSRVYTMDDTLEDMQHEVYMHNIHADTEAMVNFFKMITQFGLVGVEMLNNKVGPIVDLNGWSGELTRDMTKFDRPFTRIYRRFFKRGASNPFFELGQIVLGSMVLHIMRNKMGPMADMMATMGATMMPQAQTRNIATAGGHTPQPTTPLFPNQGYGGGGGGGGGHAPMNGSGQYRGGAGAGAVNTAESEPVFGASARVPVVPHVAGNPRPPLRRPPVRQTSSVSSLASALGGGGGGSNVVCNGDVCSLG